MLNEFCKNGHPGGKLTWITLQRMAQLVWYIWWKVAKKISQLAPRTNLSTVVGDAENEGERKKKIQRHDSTELLFCCREVSSARHGTRSMMGVVIGMFISRVWDWSRLIYHRGVLKKKGRANDKEREDDLEDCVWTAKEGRLNKFNYPN